MEGRIWSIILLLKMYNPESSGPKSKIEPEAMGKGKQADNRKQGG